MFVIYILLQKFYVLSKEKYKFDLGIENLVKE